jgi:hypothetical protein
MLSNLFKVTKLIDEHLGFLLKVIYLFMIILYVYSSNWEVDPLHEGLTFPAAVAISEGKVIFRDVHSQYGLLGPIIEGFIISITGPYLIVQRLVGSICMVLISILILQCSKNLTRINPYIPAIAYLALTPNWNYVPSVEAPIARSPWPNSYGILFQMICIYLFILYHKKFKNYLLVLSGIALGVSAFARIQFTIISLMLLILIIFFISSGKKWNYAWMLLGYISTFSIFLIFLMHQHAIAPMYNQIIAALFDEGTNSVRGPSLPVVFKTSTILFILMAVYFISRKLIINRMLFSLLLYFGIILLTFVLYPKSTNYQGKVFSLIKLTSELIVLSPIYFLVATCILIASFQIVSEVRNNLNRTKLTQSNSIYIFISAVSFLNLIQMHIISPGYFYFVIPSYLLLFFGYHFEIMRKYYNERNRKELNYSWISILLPVLLCVSMTNYFFILNRTSTDYSAPHLKYMKSYNQKVYSNIESITTAVSKFPMGSTVSVNCMYGLYAVNQHGYLSSSRYQWNYLPVKLKIDKLEKEISSPSSYLINCGESLPLVGSFMYNQQKFTEFKRFRINENEILTLNKSSK